MNHLGDITKINGATVPPVNVIIGGSPCQDLSVAGKRAGLAGKRSGLFMEQIRIIKEMRENDKRAGRSDEFIRPRFMVWENVSGAFSSNKGEDFRAVLEETVRVVDKATVIPRPPKGKWHTSGAILGDRWSIAWRVLDAQFWGVPQRRRRIALVADFGGQSAAEILFERNGVSGNTETCGAQRQGTAADSETGVGRTDKAIICIQGNCIDRADTAGCNGKGWTEDVCYTLNTIDRPAVAYGFKNNMSAKTYSVGFEADIAPMLVAGQHDASVVYSIDRAAFNQGKNAKYDFEILESGISSTLVSKGPSAVAYAIGNGQADQTKLSEKVGALNCMHDQQAVMIAAVDCRNGTESPNINGTLQAKSNGGSSVNLQNVCRVNNVVHRLTPLECERLQGFPDGWTDIGDWTDSKGKVHKSSDSARYKALGNSIALPPWMWILQRLSDYCITDRTMASLFDGIGGFPLIWERINGKGSCLWASEIEEFPIAVTNMRIINHEKQ